MHIIEIGSVSTGVPTPRWTASALSVVLHAVIVSATLAFVARSGSAVRATPAADVIAQPAVARHVVLIPRIPQVAPAEGARSGGGGGGNRQNGPIRHAEGVGSDPITLRVAKPRSNGEASEPEDALPGLVLDAKPLNCGSVDQLGLPIGGVSFGTSLGSGSGGGVGTGVGTGIGSGEGPGIGPGSGGGLGGGVYNPGGAVSTPRVLVEVKPTYTAAALMDRIQGSVLLEFVVRADGVPSDIQVVRSLDSGLDEQAVIAARQWRFEPGRFGGKPVNVKVRLIFDFNIR